MKRYTNFEEIDQDLKYLRLKSKIDIEELKLGINTTKETFKDTFSPVNLIANTLASVIKKAFVMKVIDKLVGSTLNKKQNH